MRKEEDIMSAGRMPPLDPAPPFLLLPPPPTGVLPLPPSCPPARDRTAFLWACPLLLPPTDAGADADADAEEEEEEEYSARVPLCVEVGAAAADDDEAEASAGWRLLSVAISKDGGQRVKVGGAAEPPVMSRRGARSLMGGRLRFPALFPNWTPVRGSVFSLSSIILAFELNTPCAGRSDLGKGVGRGMIRR